jgi:hypothetical protein
MSELSPYDTGERCEPKPWISGDRRRPAEEDRDRYGKVDFENDSSENVVTVHVERSEKGEYVLVYYATGGEISLQNAAEGERGEIPAKVSEAFMQLGPMPPHDTMARALWRARFIATTFYDEADIEPLQNLGDILTDLVHYADHMGLNIHAALDKAYWMVDEERKDWQMQPVDHNERLFR